MVSQRFPVPRRRDALAFAGALVASLASGGFARAEPNRPLVRLAMSTLAPPFSWADDEPNGAIHGLVPDTLKKVFAAEGSHDASFSAYPWARAQQMVRAGLLDGFCTNPTPARREYALFGSAPVMVAEFGIVTNIDNPRLREIANITSIAELRRFEQVDFYGNSFAEDLFKDFRDQILWQRDLEGVFRMIDNGRADLAYVNEASARFMMPRLGIRQRMVVLPVRLSPPSAFHLGLRRDYPDAAGLLERLDAVLAALRRNGLLTDSPPDPADR